MHILVVNDDGPPSQQSSPYIHSFIHTLQSHGHTVSVVLPHIQRSWIGKAHLAGRRLTPTYFRPGTLHTDDGTTHTRPRTDGGEEWVLIDGTPASCTQIGLNHYFHDRGKIDMVVSGPNYGRNSTSLFSLSSGTIGGAMEGAVCGVKSVALSYAFFDRNHDPAVIKGASEVSVRVVQYLFENWAEGVDLYSVNVPLLLGVDGDGTKVLYTNILQNYWTMGSSFEEVEANDELDPDEREMQIREGGEGVGGSDQKVVGLKHKTFQWAPKFADVYRSVEEAPPGNDGWAVKEGHVSVTPLKANFMHFDGLIGGEIKLESSSAPVEQAAPYYALVDYTDPYVRPRILAALHKHLPALRILTTPTPQPNPTAKILHWSSYESIPFEDILAHPDSALCSSYIIRKALIRKHYLSHTLTSWTTKHPASILAGATSTTCELELDYAEYLDEALAEAYELRDSLAANDNQPPSQRQWWILKPGMSDRGQGIRLFSTLPELEAIFEEFEGDDDTDDEDEDNDNDAWGVENGKVVTSDAAANASGIVTSQLRHFVAQSYIHPPLLIANTKFHIRTYVLAVGGLRVYVYRRMLALFAGQPYVAPWEESADLSGHLTNTCLQSGDRDGSVRLFWDLADDVAGGKEALEGVWSKIQRIVGETWEAAARGQRVHFQTLPNAFEVFGVDFLVDAAMGVYLLEVNAYPDFRQTGEELGGVIDGLFEGVVERAVMPFLGVGKEEGEGESEMVKVLDVELGSW
ncbi:sure-like protein [Morchella conica CCBAS932]|uniref:Sure-like protein n=1 Tax=Morchella conica CCBAS932 TaxID=1392247 RepID=A0A3N4KM20_9PEZI|nr:sure-like protein [Morchella conica CCBAS932]